MFHKSVNVYKTNKFQNFVLVIKKDYEYLIVILLLYFSG